MRSTQGIPAPPGMLSGTPTEVETYHAWENLDRPGNESVNQTVVKIPSHELQPKLDFAGAGRMKSSYTLYKSRRKYFLLPVVFLVIAVIGGAASFIVIGQLEGDNDAKNSNTPPTTSSPTTSPTTSSPTTSPTSSPTTFEDFWYPPKADEEFLYTYEDGKALIHPVNCEQSYCHHVNSVENHTVTKVIFYYKCKTPTGDCFRGCGSAFIIGWELGFSDSSTQRELTSSVDRSTCENSTIDIPEGDTIVGNITFNHDGDNMVKYMKFSTSSGKVFEGGPNENLGLPVTDTYVADGRVLSGFFGMRVQWVDSMGVLVKKL